MNIMVFNGQRCLRYLNLTRGRRALFFLVIISFPLVFGYWLGVSKNIVSEKMETAVELQLLSIEIKKKWSQALVDQRQQTIEAREDAQRQLNAMSLRVAQLQARLTRLDALGKRIVDEAKLQGEFDFTQVPALGGPKLKQVEHTDLNHFMQRVDQLILQISDREQQLETLGNLVNYQQLERDRSVSGWPVEKGWISSNFGTRADPLTGARAWHNGIDIANRSGTKIIAVAAGVVVASDVRRGYGKFIEVNHTDGYKTRYAHNKKNLVKVGDVVKKGQVIALMGSTGRSTGPHLHFEVHKDGKAVNPATYIGSKK